MKLIKHDKLEEAIADTGINNMDMSDVDNDTKINIEVPFQYADAIKKHKERIKRNSELFKETDKLGDELVKENQRDSHSEIIKTEPLRKMKLSESLFEDWDEDEGYINRFTSMIGNILDDQYEDGAYEDHGLSEEEFMTIYNLYDGNITDKEFIDKVISISPEYGNWLKEITSVNSPIYLPDEGYFDLDESLTEATTKPFDIDDVDIFDLVYRAFTFSDDQVTLKDESGKPMNPKVIQGIYTEDEVGVTRDDKIKVRVDDEKLLDLGIKTAEEYEIDYEKGYDKSTNTYTLTLDPWTVNAEKLYYDYNFTDKFTKGAHAQKSYSTAGKRGKKTKKEDLKESIKISVEEFIPSDEAFPTFDLIKESGKLEELDELTDQMYDKGITAEQLNDLLLYDRDWVLEMLDIVEEV